MQFTLQSGRWRHSQETRSSSGGLAAVPSLLSAWQEKSPPSPGRTAWTARAELERRWRGWRPGWSRLPCCASCSAAVPHTHITTPADGVGRRVGGHLAVQQQVVPGLDPVRPRLQRVAQPDPHLGRICSTAFTAGVRCKLLSLVIKTNCCSCYYIVNYLPSRTMFTHRER